ADLRGRITELLLSYRDRLDDPAMRPADARPVRLLAVGYPLPHDPV
nr:ArsR family transcriptional regulator [Pseudonocardiales bacterium]